MTSDLEAELEMLCLGASGNFDTLGVELMGFEVAKDIVQYQKKFKRQSLTGKVLPDFRDKALTEPIQKNGSGCLGLLVVKPKDWHLVFIFSLQSSGVSSLIDKGSPDHKPDCICTKQ